MASLKLYLDDRKLKKDGTAQIKVAIRNAGSSAFIPTGYCVPPDCWNGDKVVAGKSKALLAAPVSVINSRVQNLLHQYGTAVGELFGTKSSLSASEIRDRVIDHLSGKNSAEEGSATVGDVMDGYLSSLEKRSTLKAMTTAVNSMRRLPFRMDKVKASDLSNEIVDRMYRSLEASGIGKNTVRSYMIVYKSAWHWGQREGLAPEGMDPFKKYRTTLHQTRSRALSIEEVRELWYAEPPKGAGAQTSVMFHQGRDLFRLFIGLAGINVVDLIRLTTADIQGGRIRVNREKTGVPIDIRVEPEVMEVFRKYTSTDGLLIGKLIRRQKRMDRTDEESSCPQRRANQTINNRLHLLDERLTSYWMRHTWASLCAEMDVPDRVISMGLAHRYGNVMDNIYITNRTKKLDEANRALLDWIQCDKDCDRKS